MSIKKRKIAPVLQITTKQCQPYERKKLQQLCRSQHHINTLLYQYKHTWMTTCLHASMTEEICARISRQVPDAIVVVPKVTIIALGPVYQTLLAQFRLFGGTKLATFSTVCTCSVWCCTSIQWCVFRAECTSIWCIHCLLVSALTFLTWKRRCHTEAGIRRCLTFLGKVNAYELAVCADWLAGHRVSFV